MKRDEIESLIIELLLLRKPTETICPSEVARKLFPENWRDHMDEVRAVAIDMSLENILEITQKGKKVSPPFRGPIRLRFSS